MRAGRIGTPLVSRRYRTLPPPSQCDLALSIAYSSDRILSLMLSKIATAAELRNLKLSVHLASLGLLPNGLAPPVRFRGRRAFTAVVFALETPEPEASLSDVLRADTVSVEQDSKMLRPTGA